MSSRPFRSEAPRSVPELVGESKPIVEVRHKIVMAARSDVHVLITGDTGTGKELVSRAIHAHSALASGPFIPHNCALAPQELFESEFFGHRKGSFTGADRDRAGLLKEADGGVLFLDELETMIPAHQATSANSTSPSPTAIAKPFHPPMAFLQLSIRGARSKPMVDRFCC